MLVKLIVAHLLQKLPNFLLFREKYYYRKTPWPESASELYQLLSAKLVPTFADRG
jgi:hypothetical protein